MFTSYLRWHEMFNLCSGYRLACHCEPVRRLAWQSPGTKYVSAVQIGEWYQEIATSA